MAEQWERLTEESPVAFDAFTIFRDLGPERSLPKAVALFPKRVNVKIVRRWQKQFRWEARAAAFDRYVEQERRAATTQEEQQMAVRHQRTAMLLQAKAMEALNGLEPQALTTGAMARLIEVGQKLERTARGTDQKAANRLDMWERLAEE